MIKGTTEIKPYQNLSAEQAQEVADVYFKSSIEMAIASLQSGLAHAKKTNNLNLVALLEKDIATYMDMFNNRELEKLDYEDEDEKPVFDESWNEFKNDRFENESISEAQNAWEKRNLL